MVKEKLPITNNLKWRKYYTNNTLVFDYDDTSNYQFFSADDNSHTYFRNHREEGIQIS